MLWVQQIIPLIGTVVISNYPSAPKQDSALHLIFTALAFSIINMIQTQIIMAQFDPNTSSFQFQTNAAIWNAAGTGALLGIDGISQWLVWQINIQMPIVIQSCWRAVGIPANMYYTQEIQDPNKCVTEEPSEVVKYEVTAQKESLNQLVLCINQIGFWSIAVFIVLDQQLFYISFEGVLIPMYFLISSFGSRNRKIYAAYLFFIYTIFGSLFQLQAQLVLYIDYGTIDYQMLQTMPQMSNGIHQNIIWLAFMITFAIKLPQIPFHTWQLQIMSSLELQKFRLC